MTAVEELLSKLLHPARLLLVRSDKRQAVALQRQIQQKDECEVDWVASGAEAKHRLGQHKYDLLLLEPTPQDMSAATLLRHVKQIAPNIPVVLVSEQPFDRVAHELAQFGVVCGLIGPVEQSDIDEMFSVFKIRVRSYEDTRYFESRGIDLRAPLAV